MLQEVVLTRRVGEERRHGCALDRPRFVLHLGAVLSTKNSAHSLLRTEHEATSVGMDMRPTSHMEQPFLNRDHGVAAWLMFIDGIVLQLDEHRYKIPLQALFYLSSIPHTDAVHLTC